MFGSADTCQPARAYGIHIFCHLIQDTSSGRAQVLRVHQLSRLTPAQAFSPASCFVVEFGWSVVGRRCAKTQHMSTSSCCRPPRVEYREQEAPTYDKQAGTLALPLGSTAAAAIIAHEAHEAEAFDADAKVTFLLRIDAETTTPLCTSASKICGYCGTVVATAAVSTHMKRCNLCAWHHVIAAHVAVQVARSVLPGHGLSGGPGLRLNEPAIHRGLHVAAKAGARLPTPPQRPCSPPAPSPTEPMSPFVLPPLMSPVTLSAYTKPLAFPYVFAFAADCFQAGHEDSTVGRRQSAEDGQASRAPRAERAGACAGGCDRQGGREECPHMPADEDPSSSSTDDSIATEENAAAASASMLISATFNDDPGRPTKKRKERKRSKGLWRYESLESSCGKLWRKHTKQPRVAVSSINESCI